MCSYIQKSRIYIPFKLQLSLMSKSGVLQYPGFLRCFSKTTLTLAAIPTAEAVAVFSGLCLLGGPTFFGGKIWTLYNKRLKGQMASPKRMNFRKNSKRPLTTPPPLIFGKSYCRFRDKIATKVRMFIMAGLLCII